MAMSLLKKAGFKIFKEQADETWGRTVLEQRLELEFRLITFSMAESEVCPIYLHDALGLNFLRAIKSERLR